MISEKAKLYRIQTPNRMLCEPTREKESYRHKQLLNSVIRKKSNEDLILDRYISKPIRILPRHLRQRTDFMDNYPVIGDEANCFEIDLKMSEVQKELNKRVSIAFEKSSKDNLSSKSNKKMK